jgi:uncharacterized protein involved in outer membrane biogenesis
MKRLVFNPFFIVALVAAVLLAGWVAMMPAHIAQKIKLAIETRTGRELLVGGGSSLVFAPSLGVMLHDVKLSGSSALAEPVLRAKGLTVPLTFTQLLGGQSHDQSLILDEANIAVILNAQGHANVLIEPTPEAEKTNSDSKISQLLHIKINDGTFHFNDMRNGNDFDLQQLKAEIDFAEGLTATGSAAVKDQHVNFSTTLTSLSRAFAEGSPIDLNVDGVDSAFSFSGRIATGGSLNLAGQASVESKNAMRLLNWLGVKLQGFDAVKALSLSGALESQGATFLLKNAQFKLADMSAQGDVSFSKEGQRPSLTLAVKADLLNFNHYKNPENIIVKGWSEAPINVSNLDALNMQFQIATQKMIYNGLSSGAATIEGALKDRVLTATVKSEALASGSANAVIKLDAQQLPAKFNLDLDLAKVDAKNFLSNYVGQAWLSGALTLSAQISAMGENQSAMLSRVAGHAEGKIEGGKIAGLQNTPLAAATQKFDAQAKLDIAEGVVTLGENSFSGTGEVDILRRALAITLAPPAKPKTLITGYWDAPKISTIALGQQ